MRQSALNVTANDPFFLNELRQLGPHNPPTVWALVDAQSYCRRWARKQYENFSVVSWLLPRRIRQDFFNVYAFCRWSDNLADEVDDPDTSRRLLDWWQGQLCLCYSGRPAHPVLVALQSTIHKHQLPRDPFLHLLSAFEQDQRVSRYETEAELLDYCARSANPVGRILLMLAKADGPSNAAWSDQICTGLQLANFCQDMERDAAAGRIYAPRTLWQRHHVNESQLTERKVTPALQSMLAEWVESTRGYFHRGWPVVNHVPAWLATDVDLFVRGGLAVLDKIEAADFDVWTRRPVVSKFLKVRLLCRSLARRTFGRAIVPMPTSMTSPSKHRGVSGGVSGDAQPPLLASVVSAPANSGPQGVSPKDLDSGGADTKDGISCGKDSAQ